LTERHSWRSVWSQVADEEDANDLYTAVTTKHGPVRRSSDYKAEKWSNQDAGNYAAVDHRAHKPDA